MPTTRTHTVTGARGDRLHVEDHGDPAHPPVVLVHGIGMCRHVWRHQVLSDLTEDLRLVTVDLRGHGASDVPPDGYGESATWADDLRAVRDTLELDRPVLLGWSYGGAVICDHVAAHGTANLAGIVLVAAATDLGAPALPGLGPSFLAASQRMARVGPAELVAVLDEFVGLLTAHPLPTDEAAEMRGWSAVPPGHVRAGMLRRTLDHEPTLRALRVPTLVLQGDRDEIVLAERSRVISELVPGATLGSYPDVGHMPFWETPERFNADLRNFVRRVSDR